MNLYGKDDLVYLITAPAAPPHIDPYETKQKRYGPSVEVRTEPKIGRNQLCPCGSGVKYKKCCGK